MQVKYSEKNIHALYERIGMHALAPVVNYPYYKRISIPDSCWPQLLYLPVFRIASLHEEVNRMKKEIQSIGTSFVMMCSPDKTEAKVVKELLRYSAAHGEWMGMCISLDTTIVEASIADFEIRQIQTEEECIQWCAIVNDTLMGGGQLKTDLFYKLTGDTDFHFFAGFYKNKMVTTALLFQPDSEAGVYLVASLPEYRRMGLASALMKHVLLFSKQESATSVHLQATNAAESMYATIGFLKSAPIPVFRFTADFF